MRRAGSRLCLLRRLCRSPSFSSSPSPHGCLRHQRLDKLANPHNRPHPFPLPATGLIFSLIAFDSCMAKKNKTAPAPKTAATMASSSTDGDVSRPATPVDPNAITTSSLKALQSADQRKVMDIVDKLRRTGLSGIVELPQLVVCGDQSSGKSSVLEAITEIPFPRKENLCTRFATEVRHPLRSGALTN